MVVLANAHGSEKQPSACRGQEMSIILACGCGSFLIAFSFPAERTCHDPPIHVSQSLSLLNSCVSFEVGEIECLFWCGCVLPNKVPHLSHAEAVPSYHDGEDIPGPNHGRGLQSGTPDSAGYMGG